VHALPIEALLGPEVMFFTARRHGELLAVGALKHLDARHCEVKSMHTAQAARRRGIGRAMLDHLIAVARDGGYRRISLETGSMAAFESARKLYGSAGFSECGAFGAYPESPTSTFMTLKLTAARSAADAS